MSTEVAELLVTADADISPAETKLTRLEQRIDQSVQKVAGSVNRIGGSAVPVRGLTSEFNRLAGVIPLAGGPIGQLVTQLGSVGQMFNQMGASSRNAIAQTIAATTQARSNISGVLTDIAKEGAAVDAAVSKAAQKVQSLTTALGKAQYAQRTKKADFVQSTSLSLGTPNAVDAGFLRSVAGAKTEMERLDLITAKLGTDNKAMAAEVENAALSYQQLGRKANAELSPLKQKLAGAEQELQKVSTSAGLTKTKLSELASAAKAADAELSQGTSVAATLTAGLGNLLAVSGLVVVSLAAVAAAGVAFTLMAAEAGSHMKDLAQETGLTVETLFTLEVAAKNSGQTLQQAKSSAELFFKNLSEGAHNNPAIAKQFQRFGIDVKKAIQDPEAALIAFMDKLAKMPNAAERLDAAFKLASRGGKSLAAIAAEMTGGFEAYQQMLRETGTLMSTDFAEKSDKLSDKLNLLKVRISLIGYAVAEEMYPAVDSAMKKIDASLQGDQKEWKQLGKDIADLINTGSEIMSWANEVAGALDKVQAASENAGARTRDAIDNFFGLSSSEGFGDKVGYVDVLNTPVSNGADVFKRNQEAAAAAAAKAKKDKQDKAAAAFNSDYDLHSTGHGGSAESKAVKAARQEIALLQVELQAKKRLFDTDNKDTDYYYESGLKNLDNYVKEKIRIENDAYDAEVSVLEKQRDAAEKEGTGKTREVAVKKANDSIQALWESHQAKLAEIDRKQYAQQLTDMKASWDAKIGLMQTQASGVEAAASYVAEKGRLSFQSAAEIIYNAQREILDQQKAALEDQMKNFADGTSKKTEIVNQLADLMAQIKNLEAKGEADSADAEQKDTDRRLANLNTLQSIGNQTIDIERGIRDTQLKMLEQAGVRSEVLWKKQADLARKNEAEDLRRQLDQLAQQRAYTAKYVAVEQGRAEQLEAIDKQVQVTKAASYQRQLAIQEEFLQKQRDKLKSEVDGIVDSFNNALDAIQQDGWKGFFKSLGTDFLATIRKMESDLLKSQLYKALAAIKGIKLEDTQGNPSEADKNSGNPFKNIIDSLFGKLKPEDQPRAISEPIVTAVDTSSIKIVEAIRSETVMLEQTLAQLRSSTGYAYSDLKAPASDTASADSGYAWLNKILGIGNTSSEIKAAGDATSGAIKDAGGNTVSGIQNQGSATQKGLTSISQSLLSGLAGVASMIANSNTRGGFWKGLFAAAATAAVGAAIGKIPTGGSGGGNSGGGSGSGTGDTGDFAGGLVHRSMGGPIWGPGSQTSDNIMGVDQRGRPTAMVSPGEYVINALAVQSLGLSRLNYLNMTGKLPQRASGGFVGSDFAPVMATSGSGGGGHSGKGGTNVYLTQEIHTKDPQSFFRSGRQIARSAHRALSEQLG